jgi:hypothetical protein
VIRLEIDATEVADMIPRLLDLPYTEVKVALRLALEKALQRAEPRLRRAIRDWTRVPANIVRRRLVRTKVERTQNGYEGRIWFGSDPINVAYFPGTRQYRRAGVVTRLHGRFPSAFIAEVYKKQGSQMGPIAVRRVGKARFPVEQIKVELTDGAARAFYREAASPHMRDFLHRTVVHELRFRLNRAWSKRPT